jgi:C-terminal processing protease CtpA/Prc
VQSTGIGETDLLRAAHEKALAALDVGGGGGGGGDDAFVKGAWEVLLAARVGHSGLYDRSLCDPAVARQKVSGVRTTASASGFVVTKTGTKDVLGLRLGDAIVAIGDARGTDAMTDLVLTFPVCATVSPSPSGRRAQASDYWASVVPAGTPIEIETALGGRRTLVLPALAVYEPPADSSDGDEPPPEVTVRADGVAVVRVPSFGIGRSVLAAAIDQASKAQAVIIDVRDNGGGYPSIAQELAAALPGAIEAPLLVCGPPEAPDRRYGPASLDPTGRSTPLTKLRTPTAVLVNASSYSAASLFVRLAALGSGAKVVGVADAGAYSNGERRLELAGPPRLVVTFDDTRCYDDTGVPAEGAPPAPFLAVDVVPADVARGFDTQLEAAVKVVLGTTAP